MYVWGGQDQGGDLGSFSATQGTCQQQLQDEGMYDDGRKNIVFIFTLPLGHV